MNIGIIEISPTGHYTYVESICKIYLSDPQNKIIIFTNEQGGKGLSKLSSSRVEIIIKSNEESYDSFFEKMNNYKLSKAFMVTLESYSKELFKAIKSFYHAYFNFPIHYAIHNVDFWFQQKLSDKIKNTVQGNRNLNDWAYKLKIYFWYTQYNQKVIDKVIKSGGKLFVLSPAVASALYKYIPKEKINIVPFSVYDGELANRSSDISEIIPNNKKIRICIPGYVSAIRRDYYNPMKVLEFDERLKASVQLDFLGGISKAEGGEDIVVKAKEYKEKGYDIIIHNQPSVGLTEFDENLSKADFVLGNLHLIQGANSAYGKQKESGLPFTMIKATKPGLIPAAYPYDTQLKTSVIEFNTYEELPKILLNLLDNPDLIEQLKEQAKINSNYFTPEMVYKRLEGV
jgi:hypothetical protein